MDFEKATSAVLDIAKNTLGKSVTYTPIDGYPTEIKGVFSSAYVSVSLGGGPEQSMMAPTLLIKLADLTAPPAKGDTVTVGLSEYKIIDSQEDGGGGSLLILQSA